MDREMKISGIEIETDFEGINRVISFLSGGDNYLSEISNPNTPGEWLTTYPIYILKGILRIEKRETNKVEEIDKNTTIITSGVIKYKGSCC
jgi:hypothetical protein